MSGECRGIVEVTGTGEVNEERFGG